MSCLLYFCQPACVASAASSNANAAPAHQTQTRRCKKRLLNSPFTGSCPQAYESTKTRAAASGAH